MTLTEVPSDPRPTVVVTGAAGNLGRRLLPLLTGFRVVGDDICQPDEVWPGGFHVIDLGLESSFRQILELLRETQPFAVVHLAFVVDQVRNGILDIDRMWRINIAGTARVAEAAAVLN